MAREPVNRVKPELASNNPGVGGLEEFASRERVTKEVTGGIPSGWAGDRRPARKTGERPPDFKFKDGEEVLIKFLEDSPFASIFQHWIVTASGRRPYTCLETNDCPLCDIGDRSKSVDYFNVIQMTGEDITDPVLKVWYASPDPSKAIQERARNKRTSPINKDGLYFAISKVKGTNGITSYNVDPVREDELGDFGVNPLTDEDTSKFTPHGPDFIRLNTKQELAAVVRDLGE